MSIKLKALGLGLLAILAVGAFAVVNAGATTSGHFVVGSHHVFITGSHAKNTSHELHFKANPEGQKLGCDIAQYTGTHLNDSKTPTTTTSLTIVPKWEQCYTTEENPDIFNIHENGCHFVFTSRALPESNDATVHVQCPTGKAIEITHPLCTITIPPQTVGGVAGNGVTYTRQTEASGIDWITMDVKVSGIKSQYHAGICIFTGTEHNTAIMEGSVTVKGYSDAAHTKQVNITAT